MFVQHINHRSQIDLRFGDSGNGVSWEFDGGFDNNLYELLLYKLKSRKYYNKSWWVKIQVFEDPAIKSKRMSQDDGQWRGLTNK